MKGTLTKILDSIIEGSISADPTARASAAALLDDTPEVRPEKSKKEQVFEWLEQREAYLQERFNGRKQTMEQVMAETAADLPTMQAPEWHDWVWDADGNIVRAPDRSKKP